MGSWFTDDRQAYTNIKSQGHLHTLTHKHTLTCMCTHTGWTDRHTAEAHIEPRQTGRYSGLTIQTVRLAVHADRQKYRQAYGETVQTDSL